MIATGLPICQRRAERVQRNFQTPEMDLLWVHEEITTACAPRSDPLARNTECHLVFLIPRSGRHVVLSDL
jgi:hypothetical protein